MLIASSEIATKAAVCFFAVVAGGVVGVVSPGNTLGRVFWAWVSDLVSLKATFFVKLPLQVLLSGTCCGALQFIAGVMLLSAVLPILVSPPQSDATPQTMDASHGSPVIPQHSAVA